MSAAQAPRIRIADRAELRAWFAANEDLDHGVWLVYRKGRGSPVSYEDIVEEALCVGWVDSLVRRVDDEHTSTYVTPRRPGSSWSPSNVARVERLEAAQLMRPRGRAAVEQAKAAGRYPSA